MTSTKVLGTWLRRHSLILMAALGTASGCGSASPAAAGSPTPLYVVAGPAIPVVPVVGVAHVEPLDTVQDTVQIALLLDTSSSMDGLINQARSQLWAMVDQMGTLTRVVNGKTRGVRIELALFEYGNDTLSERDGYIRQVVPFTSDLDLVSEKLYGLFTNGGSEYAGQAITKSISSLQWSANPDTLRFVFLAGNETFNQGPISAEAAMEAAAAKDISVQLILCGSQDASWSAASKLAKSDLMTIDQNIVAQHIAAPQDDEILRLGAELNQTYMAYGAEGEVAHARQDKADKSSLKSSKKGALERAQLKSKKGYKNTSWDVVDAVDGDGKFLEKTADANLPAELRGKTLAEKKQLVAAKAARRVEIKAQIAKLEAQRLKHIEAERAKQASSDAPSLESELMKSTRKTASKKGYK